MAPIIYEGYSNTGYRPASGDDLFGPLGDIYSWTFHHSAGPRAKTKAQAIRLHKAYQQQHINQGFGDIGYHFSMDDFGRIYVLRSTKYKGAHVGGHNSGNVGFMLHGNYNSDKLNRAQKDTLKWLFRGGFHALTGERERDIALVRGHKEWPGHGSNDCPGENLMRHVRYLRNNEFH